MRHLYLILLLLISTSASAQTSERSQSWQLVWEDNFDVLNEDIWLVKNNFDHWGGEPQVYTSRPENVFIQDGNLVLRVNREDYSCPPESVNQWHCVRQFNTGEDYEFTSGWIETQQPAYNTQYGLIEARIMLPYGYGFWPAFWTFKADNVGATNAAEIDIFEMLGHKPPNVITTNLHLEYCNEQQPDYPICAGIPSYYQQNVINSYAYTYHTYAVEWTPTYIQWWIDDYVFRWKSNPGIVDPVRIILNMAIEPGYAPNASTPFPSDVLIDHVRVYSMVTATSNSTISDADLSVFPNPGGRSGPVYVQAYGGLMIHQIRMLNELGQEIHSIGSINSPSYDLELSEFPTGVYFIELMTSKGLAVKRFFLQ